MKKLFCLLLLLAGMSFGQTTVAPFLSSKIQLLDNSGVVCSGCLLDTFAAGTTTPLATYSESTGTSLNANPVVLDSAGRATVYLTSATYKFRLRSAAGVTLWTQDVISWSTPLSTFAGLIDTGDLTLQQSTAATSGANQSSNNLKVQSRYWTGSADATETCNLQDVLGTGSNPTVAFTLTCSGSSGATTFSVVPNTAFTGNVSVGGTLGVTGASTLSSVNNTCYVNAQTGATADVKFNACIASLPSAGGVVDGTGLQGAQTVAARVDGSAKPIKFKIGGATFTVSSSVGFDLGTSGSIEGLAPGPSPNDSFTTPVSIIKAGVNNAVLVRSTGVGGGQVIRNVTLDGNRASFSGAIALQLTGAVDTQIENITVKNCGGEAVQLIAPIEVHWTNGLVENNGTSAAIHASATGIGSGSGNLSLKNITVRLNGGDGILIEGGGAGIKLDTMNIDRNGGAGIRLQMQSVINAAPTGLTLDTVTLESNADATAQLVVSGSTSTIVSLNALNLTCNGSLQLASVSPTCFALDNVVFATFIGGYAFSGTNAFAITNSSNVDLFNFRNTDTNLYAGGTSPAAFQISGGAVIFSNDVGESRLASGLEGIGNGSAGSKTGLLQSGNTVRLTADFTDASSTALQAITGLSWTVPAFLNAYSFHCSLLYSQATAAVSDQFGVQVATNAPTNVAAAAVVYSSSSASTLGTISGLATTTPTSIVTFTPSAITTVFGASIDGSFELPASANTINIMVSQSTAGDLITIKRGSYCQLF